MEILKAPDCGNETTKYIIMGAIHSSLPERSPGGVFSSWHNPNDETVTVQHFVIKAEVRQRDRKNIPARQKCARPNDEPPPLSPGPGPAGASRRRAKKGQPAGRKRKPAGRAQDGAGAAASPVDYTQGTRVVVDGEDVGRVFSRRRPVARFDARGVLRVLDYYAARGVRAVAFLPESRVRARGGERAPAREQRNARILARLDRQGRLALTQSEGRDPDYLLRYAMREGADVVSRRRFARQLRAQRTRACFDALRAFLDKHLIPYTFVDGAFCPRPDGGRLQQSVHAPNLANSVQKLRVLHRRGAVKGAGGKK